MEQLGLFEHSLYLKLGGIGIPTPQQSLLLRSLINKNIIPILGGWYVPKKKKHGKTLDLEKFKTRFFSSKNS